VAGAQDHEDQRLAQIAVEIFRRGMDRRRRFQGNRRSGEGLAFGIGRRGFGRLALGRRERIVLWRFDR
jgi:hypothetical protein